MREREGGYAVSIPLYFYFAFIWNYIFYPTHALVSERMLAYDILMSVVRMGRNMDKAELAYKRYTPWSRPIFRSHKAHETQEAGEQDCGGKRVSASETIGYLQELASPAEGTNVKVSSNLKAMRWVFSSKAGTE